MSSRLAACVTAASSHARWPFPSEPEASTCFSAKATVEGAHVILIGCVSE